MHKLIRAVAFAAALAAALASGQQQPSQSAPPYGMPVTLEQARSLAAAVSSEAARGKHDALVVAIVQPGGDLVYFEKMDAASYVGIQFAQMKARMAARYRSPSGRLPPNAAALPDAIPLPGGLPLVFEGRTIGAIGISGAERGEDVRLAQAAIDSGVLAKPLEAVPAPREAPAKADAAPAAEPPVQRAPAYGPPITLEQAKFLATQVSAEAARRKKDTVAVALVQPSGELVYFEKMDGATSVAIQHAQLKARMAARWRFPSGTLPPDGASLPDAISLGGGIPVVYEGRTIGAIGITGVEEHGAAARVARDAIDALQRRMKLFDAHVHLISDDIQRYPQVPPLALPPGTRPPGGGLPPGVGGQPGGMSGSSARVDPRADQILRWMNEQGVTGMAAVQKRGTYGVDNRYILDSADLHSDRMAPVVVLDAEDVNTPDRLRELARTRGLAGIRLTGARARDGSFPWLSSPKALRAWAAANEAGLVIDLMPLYPGKSPEVIAEIVKLARDHPRVRVVLDHLTWPDTDGPPDYGIDATHRTLAQQKNIYYKLTAINLDLLREARVPSADFLRHVVDVYGADHVMWGSDVGNSAGTYEEIVGRIVAATARLSDAEKRAVLHDTGKGVFIRGGSAPPGGRKFAVMVFTASPADGGAEFHSAQRFLTVKADTAASTLPHYVARYDVDSQAIARSPASDEKGSVTLVYETLGGVVHARDVPGSSPATPVAGRKEPTAYVLIVMSNATPGNDAAYDTWYDQQHVPDVLRIPGFATSRRYVLSRVATPGIAVPRYMVMFAFESFDLEATIADLKGRHKTGQTKMSPAFDPQGVHVYYSRVLGPLRY